MNRYKCTQCGDEIPCSFCVDGNDSSPICCPISGGASWKLIETEEVKLPEKVEYIAGSLVFCETINKILYYLKHKGV